jgi:pimeloyl-ACP methyl ester carboxylesterase
MDIVKLYFRTPANRQEIIYGNSSTLTSTSFNPNLLTVLLIHGFSDNSTGALAPAMNGKYFINYEKECNKFLWPSAYLASPLNYNFIAVDWGRLSGNNPSAFSNQYVLIAPLIYTQVVESSIPIVANRTTQFIQFLNLNPALVHIVGHSLGSHVSGLVGSNYQANNGGKKFARITGLDPAGLIWFGFFYCQNDSKKAGLPPSLTENKVNMS